MCQVSYILSLIKNHYSADASIFMQYIFLTSRVQHASKNGNYEAFTGSVKERYNKRFK